MIFLLFMVDVNFFKPKNIKNFIFQILWSLSLSSLSVSSSVSSFSKLSNKLISLLNSSVWHRKFQNSVKLSSAIWDHRLILQESTQHAKYFKITTSRFHFLVCQKLFPFLYPLLVEKFHPREHKKLLLPLVVRRRERKKNLFTCDEP